MSADAVSSDLPIELSHVDIDTGRVKILRQISLSIEAGAPTVLIGPNGSGKTTLLRAAMGLIAPSSGRVTWGGHAQSPPLRRAIVFQRPVMLRRSAFGNLHYALASAETPRNARRRRANELLSLVDLDGLGDRPARRLSGGEQQRLAIARALAREPRVLFLDEPTASLDPAATKAIEELVRSVSASGVKVVMATHDLGEARRLAGDIVLLHRGTIVERAAVDRFFNAPATKEAQAFLAGELLL
ncbi:MAG TPA: ATP-binding cassette domain-containing protein [Steroidobacteraceae bacterium]|nr:ATP-binding cassette domain-containing protein [Steroidobacteraceae bacterium]